MQPKIIRKKKQKSRIDSWSRWHPWNPILKSRDELEEFMRNQNKNSDEIDEWSIEEFLDDIQPTITYSDPNCKTGDFIEDLQRNIKVALNKYECRHCGTIFPTHAEAMDHIVEFNEKSKKLKLSREDIKELTYTVFIPRARIFYENVRPEEIEPLPVSVEVKFPTLWVDGRDMGKFDAQKSPSGKERERYDEEMRKWRKKMSRHDPMFPNDPPLPFPQIYEEEKKVSNIQSTQGQRKARIVLLPNGDIQEKGAEGRWWYYCPQILKILKDDGLQWPVTLEDQKTIDSGKAILEWCPARPADIPNWAKFHKTRVLFLLGIIKEVDMMELEPEEIQEESD